MAHIQYLTAREISIAEPRRKGFTLDEVSPLSTRSNTFSSIHCRDLRNELLDLIVTDKHKGTTGTTQDVGASALEEGAETLLLGDLGEAVDRAVVELLLGTGLHH